MADVIPVRAVLDTGFTGGWQLITRMLRVWGGFLKLSNDMQTARGEARFNLYQGTVLLDGQEFTIAVLGGDELEDILLGVPWLQTRRLVADFPAGVLTLR
jgi:predicted aspartyl protease